MLVTLHVWLFCCIFGVIPVKSEFEDPCENHLGFTEEEANEVMENWPANLSVSRVNRTHKCRVACIIFYYGLANTNGDIHLYKYYHAGIIDQAQVSSTLVKCHAKYIHEKDVCEYAFGIFYCYRLDHLLRLESTNKK
uniref:Odorant-binding protein 57d2 n=1 Tax=Drosophila varians TaxID=30050 RepID=B0M2C7_DROVA|nr:odorant-binding protein 57d2 [Drosophila varians]